MQKKRGRTPSPSIKSIKFALLMYKHLISEQRYTISVMLQNGMKRKEIAEAIGVSASTITRELQRNSGSRGKYRRWFKFISSYIYTSFLFVDVIDV